ncbi:hypothetical protein HJC23_006642 [Cyclotella cryptica]|uniref:Calmodulin n=1 Tax=Cyclotella cryptica TaxID=29204 RepID=A0ABD3R6L0_9STRA|eukprot:CCRYP_001074-RA/>CCRYP_001074-RA protein AED:0.00 eAED:0.00 QI:353/1/1/1/1/1/2/259/647
MQQAFSTTGTEGTSDTDDETSITESANEVDTKRSSSKTCATPSSSIDDKRPVSSAADGTCPPQDATANNTTKPPSSAKCPATSEITWAPDKQMGARANGQEVTTSDDDDTSVESGYSFDRKASEASLMARKPNFERPQIPSASTFKYKPAFQKDSTQPRLRATAHPSRPLLGLVSRMYDIDGDGVLNETEMAMRDMDIENKGHLTKEQVYQIVKEQLETKYEVTQYKKVTLALTAFMVLLALSNFGTSFTSAILTKEINADPESGAVLVKGTGETIGFDTIGTTFDFVSLSDEEYSERRNRVLQEMSQDKMHSDHMHRHLGKMNGNAKIAFDEGKVLERDLIKIVEKCDGSATVNIRRLWSNADGSADYDYDTLCGPGTTVTKKERAKRTKKKSNVRTVTQQIVFKKGPRRDTGGEEEVVVFTCNKGWCHGSGSMLQQSEGHPCTIQRGNDECTEGLLCYAGEAITSGTGVCTRFARNRKVGQMCDLALGLDACTAGSTCVGNINSKMVVLDDVSGKVKGMGTCTKTAVKAMFGQICDASYGKDSCLEGLVCMDLKGRLLNGKGNGVCGRVATPAINYSGSTWYVDYNLGPQGQGQCVRDCPLGKFNNCGGNAENYDELYTSWQECCKEKLWWVNTSECVPDWPVVD